MRVGTGKGSDQDGAIARGSLGSHFAGGMRKGGGTSTQVEMLKSVRRWRGFRALKVCCVGGDKHRYIGL